MSRLPLTVSLCRLFPSASFVGCADIRVSDATERSGECGPGVLFAAIRGSRWDGTQFVDDAVRRGASALLVERPLASVAVPQCVVPNARRAYAQLCAALAGDPTRSLDVAGVTGTNGKTTVTWLVRSILESAGRRSGLLGTIGYSDGTRWESAGLTTPDSKTLTRWLEAMRRCGVRHAAIEVSSHALEQDRISGVRLAAAAVTNITQDHFDYHNDAETYRAAKAKIFEHCKPGAIVALNVDDPGAKSLETYATRDVAVVTYGIDQPADVSAVILNETLSGTRFLLQCNGQEAVVSTALIGRHNVSNCLAASAMAGHLGLSLDRIAVGIEALPAVPGRLERIACGQEFDVFVDYAHTDDALRRCIQHLKQLTKGRVICVFGAGGDRDRSKRPRLGQAASPADLAVVTSDNPRTEDPMQIIRDILPGFEGCGRQPVVEPDRAEAIRWALEHAVPGDCVLIAGKGHETEQVIGERRFPFDDREIVRRLLSGITGGTASRRVKITA